jgi:hypothetical protein
VKISVANHQALKRLFGAMEAKRRPMWPIWRELAAVYLPYRHPWLLNQQKAEKLELNPYYITSEGLLALRTQSAGLMNGITSPTRPWFKITMGDDTNRLSIASRKWLSTCTAIMYSVMARSNYYNNKAMSYFDLGLMNIAGTQIFEDRKDVIRCQRFNTGEFFVEFDFQDRIIRYGRKFYLTLENCKREFGEENLPPMWREQLKNPSSWGSKRMIYHLCEVDSGHMTGPASRFAWHEFYWAEGAVDGEVLRTAGYREQPASFPRWSAELEYGNSPAMDALADMRELQQLILSKGTGLEKMIDPPMLYDEALRNKPKSTVPGGYAYVPNLGEMTGARAAYQLNLPIQELRADIQEIKGTIREIFHNDLFKMISQLDTVRSATEVDARREEKLVLLAHFLERFENESLDPDIERIFAACQRADLFPLPPREIANREIDISYVSILATAQRSINTVPMERLLAMVGQIAGSDQTVLDLVDFDEFVYTYAADLSVDPSILRDAEQLAAKRQQREQQLAALQATATAGTAIEGAKTLSETDVGGGKNALQALFS